MLDSEAAKGFALGNGFGLIALFIPVLNLVSLIAWIGAQFYWQKMPLRPKLSLGEVALQAFTLTPIGTFAFFLSVESALQTSSRDVVVN
ncbi:MAG: hypothetical protein IOD12_13900 [Silvanigrellales bacterium]|nr:hypothetical protein [Silvanigrellales bacterium]